MKRFLLMLIVPSLLVLGGCKRSVCGYADTGFDPISPEWQAHKELVPAGATVCGHFKAGPGVQVDMKKVLQIDFADDPNPWVTIVDHMEKLGFTRTGQDIKSPDFQSAYLKKDTLKVTVNTLREKGRVRAVMKLGE